jgi:GT2 family glycosyltransferase
MSKSSTANPVLSIITVNYNSSKLLLNLIDSITNSRLGFSYEHLVVDNGSSEDTTILRDNPHIVYIQSINNGFSCGNNLAISRARGNYLWFLNPDTTVETDAISYLLTYLKNHPDVGIVSPKLVLPTGDIDKNCHRGFPTIANSLFHFLKLDALFPTSKLFAGYFMGHLPLDQEREVDAVGGSSVLMPRAVGEKVGWWDEDYFMYGEDIDLAYRVKQAGFKVMYVPAVTVHHHHGASSGLKSTSSVVSIATKETRIRSVKATTNAMRIFYKKHLASQKSKLTNNLVYLGIDILEKLRLMFL